MLGRLKYMVPLQRWYSNQPKRIKSFKETIKSIQGDKKAITKPKDTLPEWKKQLIGVKKAIGNEKWRPSRRLSREEIESLRLLKQSFPNITSRELSERFKVSPEAIRRILKSNWEPSEEEWDNLQKRWRNRGERINKLFTEGSSQQKIEAPFYGKKIILRNAGNPNAFTVKNNRKQQRQQNDNDKLQRVKEKKLSILEESLLKNGY